MNSTMTERHTVIVDVESTDLVPGVHVPVEIAAINTATGEELYIAPYVDPVHWVNAQPEALAINRYFERRVFDLVDRDTELDKAAQLAEWLCYNTLAGTNPRFDLAMLAVFMRWHEIDAWEPHHRLADLSAYAAGVLGLPLTKLPGLSDVCFELGLDSGDHTAMGDARATWKCFLTLDGITQNRKAASC